MFPLSIKETFIKLLNIKQLNDLKMKTINLPLIWDYVKSYVLPFLLIILLFRQCNNNEVQLAKSESKSVKEQNAILERTAINANEKIAELYGINEQLEKDLQRSNAKTNDLTAKLNKVVSKGQKDLKRFENADNKAWAGYFKEKYNTSVTYSDVSLTMTSQLVTQIGNDLIKGDIAKAEVKIYKSLLDESDYKISVYESLVTNKDDIINEKDVIIETVAEQRDNLQTLADNQLKDLIKAERGKKLNRTLIAIGVAGGFVAGVLLAN
jgi:hypothetical protein